MPIMIAHRGAWWPRKDLQNHPSSAITALSAGWGVEVDVWGVRGNGLFVGHDEPERTFTPPMRQEGMGPLFLHLKRSGQDELVCEILEQRRWLGAAYVLYSPSNDVALSAFLSAAPPAPLAYPKGLVIAENMVALTGLLDRRSLFEKANGVWLEQPDDNWVDEEVITTIQTAGKTAWVLSSELHGRLVNLRKAVLWKKAEGICTDYPHLLERVLDESDKVVHPKDSWWL